MPDGPLFVLTLLAALGSCLVAGMFLAFSSLVMPSLARLPPAQGLAAMQTVNAGVFTVWFMGTFMGTAVLNAAVAVLTLVDRPRDATVELLLGAGLYLIGAFGVTAAANVPRNTAIERLDPQDAASAAPWRTYVTEWTRWNTVRTVAALAAAVSLTFALVA
ncbi:DUF1772 domain-containing protein [Streptomyces sp. NPDC060194]|uniref:anthrone oxygenase family protein n=1 Tax=Streptomyces sp. NPDC060194 TaxID=3347069 RepID=UPI00364FA3CB